MNGNEGGGPEDTPKPDNVRQLPIKPRTPDQERAAGPRNRNAILMARESNITNLRNAPVRARLLRVLAQQTEIYNQIKDSQQFPDMSLWITDAPAGGTGVPALQTFFHGVPPEDKVLTIGMLQTWLFNTFGHLRPLYPQVFGEADDAVVNAAYIKWAPPSPGNEPEPPPPMMA